MAPITEFHRNRSLDLVLAAALNINSSTCTPRAKIRSDNKTSAFPDLLFQPVHGLLLLAARGCSFVREVMSRGVHLDNNQTNAAMSINVSVTMLTITKKNTHKNGESASARCT